MTRPIKLAGRSSKREIELVETVSKLRKEIEELKAKRVPPPAPSAGPAERERHAILQAAATIYAGPEHEGYTPYNCVAIAENLLRCVLLQEDTLDEQR